MLSVDFDINTIFSKIEEDEVLQEYFTRYGILYNSAYQEEVIKRIQRVYINDFDLYEYLMGETIETAISEDLTGDVQTYSDFDTPGIQTVSNVGALGLFDPTVVPALANNTYDLDITIDGVGPYQTATALLVTDTWADIASKIQTSLRAMTLSTEKVIIFNGKIQVMSTTLNTVHTVLVAPGTAGSGGGDILAAIDLIVGYTTNIDAATAGLNIITPYDTLNYIGVPDGTFRISIGFGDDSEEELYEDEVSELDFFSLTTVYTTGIVTDSGMTGTLMDGSKDFSNLANTGGYVVRITNKTSANYNVYRRIVNTATTPIDTLVFEDFPSEIQINDTYQVLELPSTSEIIDYLNLKVYDQSTNIYIKDLFSFSYNSTTNKLTLNLAEQQNEERKISLTISNSSLVGTQMYTLMGFNRFGTTFTSNVNLNDTFLNNNASGYIAEKPPWLATYLGQWDAYINNPLLTTGVPGTFGYQMMKNDGTLLTFSEDVLCGLSPSNYELNVRVDGTLYKLYDIAIVGGEYWDEVAAAIQVSLRNATGSTETVALSEGVFVFTSATTGASSAIDLYPGTFGLNPDLVNAIDSLTGYTVYFETSVDGVAGGEDNYYIVKRSGDTVIGDDEVWDIGDYVYYNDSKWKRNPQVYEYTNYELLCYVFYLDPVYNIATPRELICRRMLYQFRYTGDDWFFVKNYKSFIPEYDYEMLIAEDKLKVFLESLLVELDRVGYQIKQMSEMNNIDLAPEDYLDYIASLFGLQRKDFEINNVSFRELLKNIIDIYKIKGTKDSISLFFKFLGFAANVKEYWFDRREVFNKSANEHTLSSDYTNFRHYLVTENPLFQINKYKGLLTYENLQTPYDFDLIEQTEIQESLNLFEFERLADNKPLDYVLRLLGFGSVSVKVDNSWSLNEDKALLDGPKPPYWSGEILSEYDLEQMDGEVPLTYYYHQNDLRLFYQDGYEGVQSIMVNNAPYYIYDGSQVPNFIPTSDTFKYFKTNYISIRLTPFKLNLTSQDSRIFDNYFRFLIPIHVFFEPTLNTKGFEDEFVSDINQIGESFSQVVHGYINLKYNHDKAVTGSNLKYNHEKRYTKRVYF